jgi:hypothetical protein
MKGDGLSHKVNGIAPSAQFDGMPKPEKRRIRLASPGKETRPAQAVLV